MMGPHSMGILSLLHPLLKTVFCEHSSLSLVGGESRSQNPILLRPCKVIGLLTQSLHEMLLPPGKT